MDIGLAFGRRDVRLPEPGARRARRWTRVLAALGGTAFIALTAGFVSFVSSIARDEPRNLPRGDAIVALTGGVDRIPDAVNWLAHGRGDRLLISGVNTQISIEDLIQKAPRLKSWLSCCVDLDHVARNTVENAEETRRWADARGYRSLVVVTSSYHMPRAMLELKRQLPEARLIAAPVVTERLQSMRLTGDPALFKILGHEYGKFLVAWLRASLTTPARSDDMTAHAIRRRA